MRCGETQRGAREHWRVDKQEDRYKQAAEDYGRALALEDDKVARKRQERCVRADKRQRAERRRQEKAAAAEEAAKEKELQEFYE